MLNQCTGSSLGDSASLGAIEGLLGINHLFTNSSNAAFDEGSCCSVVTLQMLSKALDNLIILRWGHMISIDRFNQSIYPSIVKKRDQNSTLGLGLFGSSEA